ncbi:hypothetical protein GCM10011282_24900 [Undibacterium macrobrachii]|jgi:hypothetical protein|uniref:Uncharacterized protein n=1 Tax=Undibacterium macrobrachii TaxID=1119058 RepID=A0ABQ2XIB5_9BURK|nr:hypothetical protein GCM10011282_24900 [Undibacterium macrobrachii]
MRTAIGKINENMVLLSKEFAGTSVTDSMVSTISTNHTIITDANGDIDQAAN